MKNLNKIEFVSALIGLLFVAALSSCGKVDDQLNASVTIKMPDLSSSSQNLVSAKMSSSVSTPTNLSDINCYAVMVGGPAGEPDLNRTRCEIVNVTTSVSGSVTTETKTVVANRQVGIIRGLVPSNGVISIDVPAGNDRVFTLVGLRASPQSSCLSFTDPNINLDLTSNPVILGTAAGVNLTGGITNTVNIQMNSVSGSIANNNQIGECYGPDNPGTSKIVPTRAILTKRGFPSNALVANSCNALDVEFVDNLGRSGEIPVSAAVSISFDSYAVSGTTPPSGSSYDLYSSNSDCTAGAGSTDFLAINAKERSKQIWIKTASATVTSYDLTPVLTTASAVNLQGVEKNFLNYDNNNRIVSFNFFGPRRVLADTCYKMSAYLVATSGTTITSATLLRYKVENLLNNGLQDIGASFYSGNNIDPNCEDSLKINHGASSTSTVGTTIFDSERPYFFVKYSTNTSYRQTSLGLTPLASGPVSSTTFVRGVHPIEVVTGTKIPARLFIEGSNQIKTNTCGNYYQVHIANTLGAVVPASSTITLATSQIGGTGQSLLIGLGHPTNNCPGMNTSVVGTTSLTAGQYFRDFILKTSAPAGTVFRVTATANVSGTLSVSTQLQPSYFDITVTP